MSGAGSDPILRLESVSVTHAGVPAVVDLNLEVAPGEMVLLLGRNGAGKTTTLRAVAGLQRVVSGRISLDGRAVHNHAPHSVAAAGCTLVQDGNRIFRRLDVETNLRLGAYRCPAADARWRMEEQLDRFPTLRQKRRVAAGQLSGGEQQQLAIAQGLMAAPRVLLLDEPSVGLALGLVRATFALLASLRDAGMAVLVAEQAVDQPLQVADRAVVLDLGRSVAAGTPAELRDSGALDEAYLGGRSA